MTQYFKKFFRSFYLGVQTCYFETVLNMMNLFRKVIVVNSFYFNKVLTIDFESYLKPLRGGGQLMKQIIRKILLHFPFLILAKINSKIAFLYFKPFTCFIVLETIMNIFLVLVKILFSWKQENVFIFLLCA